MPLNAISLFAGIGGFCEGAKLAGWTIHSAVELDKYACHNYRLNHPETQLFEGSVSDFLVETDPDFKSQIKKYANGGIIDVVFGGFPCQGFSQIGPRDPKDPRNELYLEQIRIASTLNSRYILMENVPNMFMMKKGLFKNRIYDSLKEAGYSNICHLTLKASDYGVPQARERIFIIATVDDDFKGLTNDVIFSSVEQANRTSVVTTMQALSDLPEDVAEDSGITMDYPKMTKYTRFQKEMRLSSNGLIYSKTSKMQHLNATNYKLKLHNHHTKKVQEKRSALIRLLEPGKKADSLPKEVWNNARPEKWRRFHPDKPAHTLLAQMHRDLSEWIHYRFDRWITVREALRLQSFHDGFILETSEWQQLKQIGNAVPPLLGRIPCLALNYIWAISTKKDHPLPGLPTNLVFSQMINDSIRKKLN